jgi:hypothetical protein
MQVRPHRRQILVLPATRGNDNRMVPGAAQRGDPVRSWRQSRCLRRLTAVDDTRIFVAQPHQRFWHTLAAALTA